jgi:DHA1 family tetracycline resistance protein-like MFS transporter
MFMAGFAPIGALFLASVPIISLWNISMPAAQGMMTHRVSEREQGELQGALSSLRSITFIIGPVLFSQVFAWFIAPNHSFHVPGAPFYLAALMLGGAMVLSTRLAQSGRTAASGIPDVIPPGEVASAVSPES